MIDQAKMQENWNVLRGTLQERWDQLSRSDLKSFDGDIDRLIGLIERKTGEAREHIEGVLEELSHSTVSTVAQVANRTKDYAVHASESLKDGSKYVKEAVEEGYDVAADFSRNRPGQSALLCVGVGLFLGLMIGMSLRER